MSTVTLKPVWWARDTTQHYPPLQGDVHVDVAIIGAGITGLVLAHRLKEAGKRVAVIEMLEVGRGASGHTTAHLTAALDVDYRTLIRDFGEEGAREAAQRSMDAIAHLERLAQAPDIDARFQRVDGWRYTEDASEADDLREELEAARRVGLEVDWEQGGPLAHMRGALRFHHQAHFHPVQMMLGLARLVHGDGSMIFERTRVGAVEDGQPCVLHTAHGVVRAEAVVHATHTPVGLVLPMHARIAPYMSYVIGARLTGPVPQDLYWDTMDPYHYLRPATLPGGAEILLVGGEDHKTGQDPDPTARFEALERYTRERFPVESVDWRWGWEVFEPADGLPYIGHLGSHDNIYVGTGYSGTGMTFGTVAALDISDMILSGARALRPSSFRPQRFKPIAGGPDFLRENANVAWRYIRDRIEPVADGELSRLEPGEGRLLVLGGRKVAAWREPGGAVHVLSPVCPHARGIVHWNAATRTWDCPLHGSRFFPSGELLAGPAHCGLSPAEEPEEDEEVVRARPDVVPA